MERRYLLAFIIVALAIGIVATALFYRPTATKVTTKIAHERNDTNVKAVMGSGRRASKRKFEVRILDVEECGTLCRMVKAELINRDGYAKNVTATLELFVGNDRIDVNGKDKLVIPVGDMRPNESVVKSIRIEVSFFDGLKIRSAGYVTAKLTISWKGGREIIRKKIRV